MPVQRLKKILNDYSIYCICFFYIIFIMSLDAIIPLGVAVGVLYIVAVLFSLWAPRKEFTIFVAVISSLFTIGMCFYKPQVSDMWKVIFNRAISLLAIWVTASIGLQRKSIEQKRELAVFQRERALEDIKILRGLLSICSSCKRIKDEKGHWSRMEGYIKQHSEADFSHGLCQECAIKLYPDLFSKTEQI